MNLNLCLFSKLKNLCTYVLNKSVGKTCGLIVLLTRFLEKCLNQFFLQRKCAKMLKNFVSLSVITEIVSQTKLTDIKQNNYE